MKILMGLQSNTKKVLDTFMQGNSEMADYEILRIKKNIFTWIWLKVENDDDNDAQSVDLQ